ncbi:malonic semialdehyde reductase [Aeromicrobium alkaliterrae]|uniref:Malonic semialdehyde reductase n=1 Tax=Aeromicrobium alkaliterrae TaxID=302168 RepID=A0ABP4W012_9ACTN
MSTSATRDAFVLDEATLDLLFREARTANTWTDEPVSVDQVREVFELIKLGPTAANSQPLRLLLVEKGPGRDRLVPHMSGSNSAKTAAAPLVAVVAADTDFHERLPEHFPHSPDAKTWFSDDEARERNAVYNAALQTAYFIIGLRAAGFAAGPQSGFDKAGVDAEFFAGTTWKSQLVVNIGHPGENAWFDRLPRIAADDAIRVV